MVEFLLLMLWSGLVLLFVNGTEPFKLYLATLAIVGVYALKIRPLCRSLRPSSMKYVWWASVVSLALLLVPPFALRFVDDSITKLWMG